MINKETDNLSGSDDNLDMDELEDVHYDGPSSETLETIATLQMALEANPNQYETHIQLISVLKSTDMFEELRQARKAMNRIYPLSEDLWMDWINDEANMATSEAEKRQILTLYQKATSEYLSIKIWKSYVEYALQEYNESKDYVDAQEIVVSAQDLTRIFTQANKWTGYHIPESHLVWNVWIGYELEKLEMQDPLSPDDIKKVKQMYLDRITIPHFALEETFSALSSFISKYEPEDYEESMVNCSKVVTNTRKLLSERETFEENLINTSYSVEAFTNYLNYEMRPERRHFIRTRTLFERAIAVQCLVPSVWIDYVTFLMSMNPNKAGYDLSPKEVLAIAESSTKNCPWAGDLWESRFLLMELYHKPEEEINALLGEALSDGTLLANPQELSKVLQARCSYVVRNENKDEDGKSKIRAAFEHARDILDSVGGDPYCKFEQLWIEIEAGPLENGENARALWTKIESKLKSSSDSWLARVALERRLSNPKQARRIFSQACNIAKQIDWPEKIFEAWLLFERECGTASEYKEALIRSRAALKTVEIFRAEAALKNTYVDQSTFAATESIVAVEDPTTVHKKRKVSFQDEEEPSKVAKVESRSKSKGKTKADTESNADQIEARTHKEPYQPRISLDLSAGRHEDTCYVTNFKDDMTAAKLKEMFGEYGKVLRCTMATPKQGKPRYFAFIQFSTPEEAHAALALDGRDVGHRLGLQVKISDTDKAQRAPSMTKPPPPKESRHELHVSGLSIDVKDEELRKLIALYAEPEHIYVQRQTDTKGGTWANIKFHTEADADAAVAMNGLSFQGKNLSVTRRVFKNPEYEGLSRTEKRKLKAQKAAERRGLEGEDSKNNNDQAIDQDTGSSEPKVGEAQDKKTLETPKSGSTNSASSTKPTTKLTSMAPRTMRPRSTMATTGILKGRPARSAENRAPSDAFKPAVIHTTTDGNSSLATGVGQNSDGEKAAEAPVVPKSNADFRALMLSGALKKTRQ
ncbi:Splicing factor [Linnemannia zychae]|nr:Splicing factor [Linnemannia zychae]